MFTLDQVVPWGRSFDEYQRMFALTADDLRQSVLGCGDGPAAFNAEATRRGHRVTSVDPLYRFDRDQIRQRIDETSAEILEQVRRNETEFVWTAIRSVEELGLVRLAAMETFLDDYDRGRKEQRYVVAELPVLPFEDRQFDVALSSHFLFLYTDQLGADFHRAAVAEMCRVSTEVRIFPLLALGSRPSPLVEPIAGELRDQGFAVSVEAVGYEFQRGGNRMMRIRHALRGPQR